MLPSPISRKKGLVKMGVLVFSILFVLSCVPTQQDVLYLNDQIGALNSRVNKLEKSLDMKLSTELDPKLKSIRESQAEGAAEIEKIRREIQKLSGRVEEDRHLIKHAIERDTTERHAMKASLAKLEAGMRQIHKYLQLEPAASLKEQDLKRRPTEQHRPAIEENPGSSERDFYDMALAAYKQEKYGKALADFESFVEKYPNSDQADNAQFWIGECHMGLRQYEQAVLAYQKVIEKYRKGNKVPSAMLRQALAFLKMKDHTDSKIVLKNIIEQYPNSNEAKIAKERLRTPLQ